jgi:hypothetical protein
MAEAWIIRTAFPDGKTAFVGTHPRDGRTCLVPWPANALVFESELAADGEAYYYGEMMGYGEFSTERKIEPSRRSGADGTGGRVG